jgi:hypothetical protein
MLFYRGIAVPRLQVACTISDIRKNGLLPGKGRWHYLFSDLKPQLEALRRLPSLTIAHTKPGNESPPRVGACADEIGAAYYALRHNGSSIIEAPLLITFEADIRDVIIDGRDFLYTLFQFADPPLARPVAEQLFGRPIGWYLDRAWSTYDQRQRIAWCDLAVQDDAVIQAHAQNKTLIAGKASTRFCSAFLVRVPVEAKKVISVQEVEPRDIPDPQVTLSSVGATSARVIELSSMFGRVGRQPHSK